MSTTLVSVVVPTFNRPVLLLETLRSILAQTHRALDVVVVDNHSSYAVASTVADLGDPRVRLLQIHNHGFIGASRNFGVEQARGALVAFCDDDDLWEPDKIRAQLEAFHPDRHAAAATSARYVGDVHLYPRTAVYPREEARFEDILTRGSPVVSSLLLPTADAHFAVSSAFQHVEDFDLLLRLTSGGKTVRVLRDPLVRYRVHATNESVDRSKMLNALNVLDAHRPAISLRVHRRARARLHVIFGILALRAGAPAGIFFGAALRDRFSLRTLCAWTVAHCPSAVRSRLLSLYYALRKAGDTDGDLS